MRLGLAEAPVQAAGVKAVVKPQPLPLPATSQPVHPPLLALVLVQDAELDRVCSRGDLITVACATQTVRS